MIRFVGKKQSATAFVQTITVESIASIKQNSGTSGVTVVEAKVDSVEECINQLLAQLHSVAWALSQQWVRGLITDGSKFIFAVLDSRTNRYWISAPLQRLTSLKEIICLLAQWMIQDPKTTIQQDVAFNCL
ncbi:hypothetical protein GYMLUDRAFT_73631 [Collybiopsis luxurians FD-317 M1]|uniref:Uncharacterized protein n=1 Tax=Collybiopsis luxurians FD-317 M1 TaxID=944289 RepID=A0A0D0CX62_9AGAR|nr:hypothetical protein GYMLUDRAFT_73631 [Collybiopsis luxurians FD-317 M1]